MAIPKPDWFDEDQVVVSTAPTCGISKSGDKLPKFDEEGDKIYKKDPETGEKTVAVDDELSKDITALQSGEQTDTLHFIDSSEVSARFGVPTYYDRQYQKAFQEELDKPMYDGFTSATLGELVEEGRLTHRNGHGSAPKDLRDGEIPYIKVSDLRAGLVNINPTNQVPPEFAQDMWGGEDSGLRPFDLISPERASKNIGDFCVLLPGQTQILITREVIVLRATDEADFDQFYLLWAMTLEVVRKQWERVIFMQTNRQDVGDRFLEIEIPVAPTPERAKEVSQAFRSYFTTLAEERSQLEDYLKENDHRFMMTGG